ncbi:hypothetical protein D9M72_398610 [compost metagenome]
MQREHAGGAALAFDAEGRQRLEAVAAAGRGIRGGALALRRAQVDDGDHGLARGVAAMAGVGRRAGFGFGQRGRQACGCQQVHPAVAAVQHAHAAAIGIELAHHALEEAARHGLGIGGLVQEGGHVVERLEVAVLAFQLGGLLRHARLQVVVQPLQFAGHAVEAFAEGAELVAAFHRQAQ